MFRLMWRVIICGLLFLNLNQFVFAKPIKIVLWHAMAGPFGDEVNHLAAQFNAAQSDYQLKPIYKGSYLETLTAYSAAYRAHTAPDMVQVFEVGRGAMLYPAGVIKPVGQLLSEQHVNSHQDTMWPTLKAYYARSGQLEAFPFNVSLPVMYYNKDRLKQLGVDAQHFPKTWQEFEKLLDKLHVSGEQCGYTSAYPSWIHIETFRALNGVSDVDSKLNGQYALKQHLQRLIRWHRNKWFEYAGRHDESTVLFTSGKCTFFTQSSGSYKSLVSVTAFKVGVASIPIDEKSKRLSNVVGGGALWVSTGLSPQVEKGIAKWFEMLLDADVQKKWYHRTGYLPILKQDTHDGMFALVQFEWGKTNSMSRISSAQNRIRLMNDETIESLLAGLITVDQAIKQVEKNAAYANYRFEKNHGGVS